MRRNTAKFTGLWRSVGALLALAMLAALYPLALHADKKQKKDDTPAVVKPIDYSFIVWPNPPAIARIRYIDWYSADKEKRNLQGTVQKKNKW
ncbi:MAG: hypothetical protein WBR26_20355, partial [Candidatus Acidiferrum sp.]